MLLLSDLLNAQTPYFYKINDEVGLPSNEVYQVEQDSFGFIWVACDAGLYRYDGFQFVAYANKQQNSKSLSNLIVGPQQQIWCQNFTGQIYKTTAAADSLTLVYDGANNTRIAPVYTIDRLGNAWIATDSSLKVINQSGEEIRRITTEYLGTTQHTWFDIEYTVDDNKIYLLSYAAELFIIDAQNYQVTKHILQEKKSSRLRLLKINGEIILFTEELPARQYKLSSVTAGQQKVLVKSLPLAATGINYTINKCADKLILCSSTGISILNTDFSLNKQYNSLFQDYKIAYSFCDKEGNLWLASLQNGILVVPSIDLQVLTSDNSILKDGNISALHKLNDSLLYLGNYSGELYAWNTPSQKLTQITYNKESKYRSVRKIDYQNDHLYLARGLFSVQKDAKTNNIAALTNSRDFILDKDTIYYTRSDLSGFLSRELTGWKQHILKEIGGKKVALDQQNNIVYYACTNGLYAYKQGAFYEIKDSTTGIFGSSLWVEEGKLWVGTNNNGILVLENNKVIYRLNKSNGLTDNNIKAFAKQGDSLWIACRLGLNVFDLGKNTSFVLNEYDGLVSKEINQILLDKHTVYLATIKGLVILSTDLKWRNSSAPNIKIIAAKTNQKVLDINQTIELAYNDNNLKIDFIATAFRSRGNFVYKYRLHNFDKNWIEVNSKTPKVNFSSLPSGQYIFEVTAINEDGVSSNQTAQLSINVYAPVWQKWWFYLICSLLSITVLAWIFRARIQFIEQKAAAANQLARSQLTALKAQMNPHFMYNALNSIQALNIKKETKKANFYLNKFSLLMRKILDLSEQEQILVQDEIDWLKIYVELEKLRFGDDFDFEFSVDTALDTYQTYIPSMILQPFIENAVKHGLLHKKGQKKLSVAFELITKDLLSCTILDNGVGRKRVAKIQQRQLETHPSFATQATQKRIALLNANRQKKYSFEIVDLYEKDKSIGTKVCILIPLDS